MLFCLSFIITFCQQTFLARISLTRSISLKSKRRKLHGVANVFMGVRGHTGAVSEMYLAARQVCFGKSKKRLKLSDYNRAL